MISRHLLKKKFGLVALILTLGLSACEDYDTAFERPISPFLKAESKSLNFGEEASTRVMELRCNEEFSVELADGLGEWCNITKLDDGDLELTVEPNEEKNVRRGRFFIKARSLTDTINVAQLGWGKAILVSQNVFNVEEAGNKVELEITTNVNYDMVIDAMEGEEGTAWIEKQTAKTRGAHDPVTDNYVLTVKANNGARRTGEVIISDSDLESEIETVTVSIVQRGLDNYVPGVPQIGEDVKIAVKGVTYDGTLRPENSSDVMRALENMIDGDLNTRWKSGWNQPVPKHLIFTFEEKRNLDYILYYAYTAVFNGAIKEVDVSCKRMVDGVETDWELLVEGLKFETLSAANRIDLPMAQIDVTQVMITLRKSGSYTADKNNDFFEVVEMEFYQRNPLNFDYTTLFKDPACSELRDDITEQDILNCDHSFFKNLAWYMKNDKYPREFRIGHFKAFPRSETEAKRNKTAAYSRMDNPAGISVKEGEELAVMADLKGLKNITIRVQNLDQPGVDGFYNPQDYTVVDGLNNFIMKNSGLVYVMYNVDNYQTAPEITLHFTSGRVNGYYDTQKHEKGRWKQLLADAVDTHFDVLGQYTHMTFPTASFLNYTKDVDELVKLYDEMAYSQQEFLGLMKPGNEMFHNRSYFHVHYNQDSYLYASDYHTAYVDYALKELANEAALPSSIWGLAHELGHVNQVRPGLKWHGMTEVTNNIMALYVQTVVFGQPSRLQSQQIADYSSRYSKAWTLCVPNKMAHNLFDQPDSKADVFCKLVPFWQLQLYYGKIKGNTPKEQEDHSGFYPDLYERVRTTDNPSTDGKCQLEFVYNCCDLAKADLTDFFTAWGFLTPINASIGDYSNKQFTITEEEIEDVKARIANLGYSKPRVALEYLTDDNTEIYKNQSALIKGTAVRDGKVFTMNGWQNAVAFVVADAQDKHIYVTEGSVKTFTMTSDWQNGYKFYAVSVTGDLTDTGIK